MIFHQSYLLSFNNSTLETLSYVVERKRWDAFLLVSGLKILKIFLVDSSFVLVR